MFLNVLLLGAVAGLDPAQIGAVVFMLTRTKPIRLLIAYFVGGAGFSLIVGVVIVFVLRDVGTGKSSSVPPEIQIAVGALALVIAALVGSGLSSRIRGSVQSRRLSASESEGHSTGEQPPATDQPAGVQKLPGFEKLPPRVQRALTSESPWVAWLAGVAWGLPGAYYLAAIAFILKSGASPGSQIAALLVFTLVEFALVEVPLICYMIWPEATLARVQRLSAWMGAHRRLLIALVAGAIGLYLVIDGISKL